MITPDLESLLVGIANAILIALLLHFGGANAQMVLFGVFGVLLGTAAGMFVVGCLERRGFSLME